MNYLYLILDFFVILFPFILSFDKKVAFFKDWKFVALSFFIVGVPFLIHDYFFTDMGVWGFEADYLSGLYLLNLPIEEVLFFVVVPYACIFIYQCCVAYFGQFSFLKFNNVFFVCLMCYCLIVFFLGVGAWYSTTVSIVAFLLLLYLFFYKKEMKMLPVAFTISIIPFFIMNSILTGSFTAKPIVWYDNAQNISMRWGTIPYEDILYSFILIAGSILVFEKFKSSYESSIV